ncbi:gliding motility-associated C-terminal domain-containing protein [Desertivirga xinjiangensis]|uniref:T9SS type B sorting domain-containing protein n=1 Tax=Desertivirga xinjiangensis TaxID=539206 RepID=UPI00210E84F8|nr:gliding motility-associated C-terminal domain-containing protein [Pedobacter xinjiangensis]
MKRVLMLAILTGGLLQLVLPCIGQDVTSNLEVWYKFDYQTGDPVVSDYSGNNRDLSPYRSGQAQPFSSSFQWGNEEIGGVIRPYVYFPQGRQTDFLSNAAGNTWLGVAGSQARTFAAWVKIEPGSDDFTGRTLFAYGNENQPGGRFEIALKGHSIEFENAVNNAGNSWSNRSVATLNNTDHPQGQWFHLALVFNGTGNRKTGLILYVNGKQLPLTPVSESADLTINTVTQYGPEIGLYMLKMGIADMRFYNRALTLADIRVLCPVSVSPEEQFSINTLRDLIINAASSGASQVVIPKGTYRGTTSGGVFVYLNNASDLEIIADSVIMLCGKRTRAFELVNCKNVTLKGLTIDYEPLTFTQGDVIATGSGYVDVKIHRGYPLQPYSRIDIINPATRFRKRGSVFVWEATAAFTSDSVVRVSQPDLPGPAVVGDMASMSAGPVAGGVDHAFVLNKCRGGIKLLNVTVNAAPGFGIFEAEGEGGTILNGCKVVPGPKPAGATEARLLSASWDAIQHKLTRIGPVVENCTVLDAGDDSWSVTWDGEYTLGTVSGNTITVSPNTLQVGDTIRTSLTSAYAVITAKTNGSLELDRSSPWPAGTRFYSPNRRCENFILKNNYIHSSGRVLVKAGNGLIENNTFDNTHSGVTVNTEVGPGAAAISNLIIRNNIINGTGHFMPAPWSNQAGAISITDGSNGLLSQAGVFDNIRIENNTFSDVSGSNIVISSASNVLIKENKFLTTGISTPNSSGAYYNINQNTVVFLKNLNNVTLDSNEVIVQGLSTLLDTAKVQNFTKLRKGIFIRADEVLALTGMITSPASHTEHTAGSLIRISAEFSGDTKVSRVEFYRGATKLGEVKSPPYSYLWSDAGEGYHAITAKAFGTDNTVTSTNEVLIFVRQSTIEKALRARNLISPNGDGRNDYWEIENIEQRPEAEVSVYDKKGRELYKRSRFTHWDGYYMGAPVLPGVYFYSIREKNKIVKSGTITVVQ